MAVTVAVRVPSAAPGSTPAADQARPSGDTVTAGPRTAPSEVRTSSVSDPRWASPRLPEKVSGWPAGRQAFAAGAGARMATPGARLSTASRSSALAVRPAPSVAVNVSVDAPSGRTRAAEENGRHAPVGSPRVAGWPATVTDVASAETSPVTVTRPDGSSAPLAGERFWNWGGDRSMAKPASAEALPPEPSLASTWTVWLPSTS